jgi:hypothetical protein
MDNDANLLLQAIVLAGALVFVRISPPLFGCLRCMPHCLLIVSLNGLEKILHIPLLYSSNKLQADSRNLSLH